MNKIGKRTFEQTSAQGGITICLNDKVAPIEIFLTLHELEMDLNSTKVQ